MCITLPVKFNELTSLIANNLIRTTKLKVINIYMILISVISEYDVTGDNRKE